MEKEKMVEVKVPEISTSAANTVKTVATIILFLGILGSVIMFIKGMINDYDLILLISSFVSLTYTVVAWALLHVIANISLQLKYIQETMPLRLVSENKKQENDTLQNKGNSLSSIKVGDKVTWKKTMTKYTIEGIRDEEVYLFTGMFGGYKWIPKNELIIPQE